MFTSNMLLFFIINQYQLLLESILAYYTTLKRLLKLGCIG